MKISHLSIVIGAMALLTSCAKESNNLPEAWEDLHSSLFGGQFKFECNGALYRIRKTLMGKAYKLDWLDNKSNWYPLQVLSVSDGGLDYQGLSWSPSASELVRYDSSLKLTEFKHAREAEITKVAGESISGNLIEYSIDNGDIVPAQTHIDFFKGVSQSKYLSGYLVNVRVTYKSGFPEEKIIFDKNYMIPAVDFEINPAACKT